MLALLSEEPDSLTIVFVKKSHFFQIQVNHHVAHFQKYTLNWCNWLLEIKPHADATFWLLAFFPNNSYLSKVILMAWESLWELEY